MAAAVKPGDVIAGKYRVVRTLGAGGMGVVLAADHLMLPQQVAIKLLHPGANATNVERFVREARAVVQIKSEHVTRVLDVGALPSGAPYIVMELLAGRDLREAVEQGGPLPPAEAVDYLLQACEALAEAHALGMVHRDIKPANLFLARRADGSSTLKVLDFGVSKVNAAAGAGTDLTAAGVAVGSPRFMAPEQLRSSADVDPRADIWALGVVLHEILVGRPAFPAESMVELCMSIVQGAPEPLPPELPEGLRAAIAGCLRKAPAERHQNVAELALALLPFAGSEGRISVERIRRIVERTGWTAPESESDALPAPPAVAAAPTEPASTTQPSAAETEAGRHRVCAVMTLAIDGLEGLASRLSPEQLDARLDASFRAIMEPIEALGGEVERAMGDTLRAVFGLRDGTENDAERAVHAALAAVATTAAFRFSGRALARTTLAARVGVETGRIYAPPARAGRGLHLVGDAVKRSERLSDLAPPGAVLVGRETERQVCARFELEPLQAAGPAFRVVGVAAAQQPIAVPRFFGLETRLVGRAGVLERLLDALGRVQTERRARLLTLIGEAGLGSTRLLAELAGRVDRERVLLFEARSSMVHTDTSYGLASALLSGKFHIQDGDPLAVVQEKLRRGVESVRGAAHPAPAVAAGSSVGPAGPPSLRPEGPPLSLRTDELVSSLVPVVGAWTPASVRADAEDDRAEAKHRIAAAVAGLLEGADRPVVIVCDDAHWADEASLDLLDDLLVRMAARPLLVVCAARPALEERRPAWAADGPARERVLLGPLAPLHLEQMAADCLRMASVVPAELLIAVATRAEGSPLALRELLLLLVDAGAVAVGEAGQPWSVVPERMGPLHLPTTIQGIVQARLDRLAERGTLTRAAVVGHRFWPGAVEALPAAGADVEAALVALTERRFIVAHETSSFPAEAEYGFADGATQQVAYEALDAPTRRQWHQAVAAWLGERMVGDHGRALLAWHHERGGDLRRAAAAYLRAAEHAEALGQSVDALHNLERVRRIHDASAEPVEGEPDEGTPPADALDDEADARVAGWPERVELRLRLGDALRRIGRLDEARARYEQAGRRIRSERRRHDDPSHATEEPRWHAQVSYRLALLARTRGDMAEAGQLIDRALAIAPPEESPPMWALLAALQRRQRDTGASKRSALEGLRRCQRRPRDLFWRNAVSRLLVGLGVVLYTQGRLVAAERCYRQAARVIDERRNPYQVCRTLNNVAAARFARGDVAGARDVFHRAVRLAERSGDLQMLAIALSNLAETECRLGDHAAGHLAAERAVELGERIGAREDLADCYRNLATALVPLPGGEARALWAAHRALELAQAPAARIYLPGVAVAVARVAATLGHQPAHHAAARHLAMTLAPVLTADEVAPVRGECNTLLGWG